MKKREAIKKIALSIPALALSCSEKGIDTTIGPIIDDTQISQKTLINRLNREPFPTWSPFGEIIYCDGTYFKIIDSEGSDISDIKVIGDNVFKKTISHPNWENSVIYPINNLEDDTSEIWSRHAFSGLPKKLEFDLPEGKYEYPALSPDNNFIVFTFNNGMFLSEYPPKGTATKIPIDEKIGYHCNWVGMYDWSKNGKLAFVTRVSTRGTNIYTIENIEDINSITVTKLTDGNVHDYNPSWSQYEDYIAFDSNRNTTFDEHDVYLIKSDGTNLEKLTNSNKFFELNKSTIKNSSPHYSYPKFHPYENKLLYTSQIMFQWGINLVNKVIQ